MRALRLLVLVPLLGLAACGARDAKPPGNPVRAKHVYSFDPVPTMLGCLGGMKIPAKRTGTFDVQVGEPSQGMRIHVAPTPADADATQLRGDTEGAEVVGRIIFFVGTAPDDRIAPVEQCVNQVANKFS